MSRAAKPFILTLDISEVFCYFVLWYNWYCSEGYRFTTKQYPSYVLQGIHPSQKEIDTMSNYITYEERMEVENCLFNGKSFGEIAKVSEKTVPPFPEKSENILLLNAPVMEQTVTTLVCIGTVAPRFTCAVGAVLVNHWNIVKCVVAVMTIALTLKNRYALQDLSHLMSAILVPSVTDAPLRKRSTMPLKHTQRHKHTSLNLVKVWWLQNKKWAVWTPL